MVLRTIWASLVTTAACLLCSFFLHALEPLCWVKYDKPPPAVSSISIAQRSHTAACFEESGCLVILSRIFDPSESLWVWGMRHGDGLWVQNPDHFYRWRHAQLVHNEHVLSMTWSLSLIAKSGSILRKLHRFAPAFNLWQSAALQTCAMVYIYILHVFYLLRLIRMALWKPQWKS